MSRLREIAKFAAGFEAFHALAHGYFWYSDMTVSAFGIATTPTLNIAAAGFAAVVSLVLALFAWRPLRKDSAFRITG
ncbi:MAG: hypothetical protein J0M17_26645 [Planctomycetes bacterium]|nr:hypothetical protein [Planctomycetota bacterium]